MFIENISFKLTQTTFPFSNLGFVIAGCFGIINISINPISILGSIISAIYVMYVLFNLVGGWNSRNTLLNLVFLLKWHFWLSCSLMISLLGLVLIAAIIPFPAKWHMASLKWFGLLHKYRGRGFYLIFVGVLAFSCGIAGWVVGGVAIALGIFHFILAIWFKDTRTFFHFLLLTREKVLIYSFALYSW